MDHQYIDQHDIAGQYLRKQLKPEEHDAFQAHLVDCAECADRVLLAKLLSDEEAAVRQHAASVGQARAVPSGEAPWAVPAAAETSVSPKSGRGHALPLRAKIVAYLSPWQLAILFILAMLLTFGVASLLFFYELSKVRAGH